MTLCRIRSQRHFLLIARMAQQIARWRPGAGPAFRLHGQANSTLSGRIAREVRIWWISASAAGARAGAFCAALRSACIWYRRWLLPGVTERQKKTETCELYT